MRKILIALGIAMFYVSASAQLSFTGSALTEDFNSFTASGANGGLDGDTWIFKGFSSIPDLMRGVASPPESTGGVYYLPIVRGDNALYIQPSGSDFTPGSITLVITNNSGGAMEEINVAYDIIEYNDQSRSNSFNLRYSTDGINYTEVDMYATAEAAMNPASHATTKKNIPLTGVSIPVGQNLYIRWFSDDVGGSGSSDEIGLDNVVVSARAMMPVPTMGQWALFILTLTLSSMALGFMHHSRRQMA